MKEKKIISAGLMSLRLYFIFAIVGLSIFIVLYFLMEVFSNNVIQLSSIATAIIIVFIAIITNVISWKISSKIGFRSKTIRRESSKKCMGFLFLITIILIGGLVTVSIISTNRQIDTFINDTNEMINSQISNRDYTNEEIEQVSGSASEIISTQRRNLMLHAIISNIGTGLVFFWSLAIIEKDINKYAI